MKLRARRREYLLEYLRLVLPRGIISAGGLAHVEELWKQRSTRSSNSAVTPVVASVVLLGFLHICTGYM